MMRIIEFFENIIIKIIDKMNIVFVLLMLVLFGIMNKKEVFEWLAAIGSIGEKVIPHILN